MSLVGYENHVLKQKTSGSLMTLVDHPITGTHSIHELDFLSHFDVRRFTGNVTFEMLLGDIYPHLQYHHLPNATVPTHKLIGVIDAAYEHPILPITKGGHSKGAKTRKDLSQKPSSDSKNVGRK